MFFIVSIFAWNISLVSQIFLKRSLVFPILCFPLFLCTDHWRRLSNLSLLFFGTLHSDRYIFPFLLCLALLFFSQLFVKPPQTTILPFHFPFSWRWSWSLPPISSVQFSSVAQSCPTLCDPMNRSTPGLPVHPQLLKFTQTHVHRVGDAIQPSHLLSSPSPPAPNPSQHQSLFQWVNSSHEVAKVLEFQL